MARTRTFLAVGIDDAQRRQVVLLQRALSNLTEDVKWVEPHNLHVTVLFLGEVDDRDLGNLCRVVGQVCKKTAPFAVRLAGVGAFPTLRRPKTLWVGMDEGSAELTALHAALAPPIFELSPFRQEERSYTPHLTLGRVNGDDAEAIFAKELPTHQTWTGGTTTVHEVTIFASELRRAGPEYTTIGRAELAGS